MLGLCWTPATAQGMQKMATTMPSNPEQLLGAILVRKDIFHRFETTMHDTCLDANNLLEYLFSLYNNTAAPAERENLPTPQALALMRRDAEIKKAMDRGPHLFPNPAPTGNPQLLQPNIQNRSPDTRLQIPVAVDGHRKKIKVEQPGFQAGLNSTVRQHQNYNQQGVVKSFDNRSGFPAASNNQIHIKMDQIHNIKMEAPSSVEPHRAQSSSCLPPFSQICRQGNRPYSPASAQYSNSQPPRQDEHQKLGHDPALNNIKKEIDGGHPAVSVHQQAPIVQNSSLHIKKQRLKGYSTEGSNSVERVSRKKKHPCFCGALFTRADNLKRHIRKCHEEKLEKLKEPSQDMEVNVSSGPAAVADNYSVMFPSSSQDCIESSHAQNSESPRQHISQQYLQQEDSHNMLVASSHKVAPAHNSESPQQQISQHFLQQEDGHNILVASALKVTQTQNSESPRQHISQHYLQQEDGNNMLVASAVKVTPTHNSESSRQHISQHYLQQEDCHNMLVASAVKVTQAHNSESPRQHISQHYLQQEDCHNMIGAGALKVTAAVRWSCFCGESFDNHRLLVEHARAHDNNA